MSEQFNINVQLLFVHMLVYNKHLGFWNILRVRPCGVTDIFLRDIGCTY